MVPSAPIEQAITQVPRNDTPGSVACEMATLRQQTRLVFLLAHPAVEAMRIVKL